MVFPDGSKRMLQIVNCSLWWLGFLFEALPQSLCVQAEQEVANAPRKL
jgi:hypothetical protein